MASCALRMREMDTVGSLLQDEINKLQVLEIWVWRQLETISSSYGKSNEEVLSYVDESKYLM